MRVFVCLGNVPDTTTKVTFTENNSVFDNSGVQWIINPWDELALTRAIELKEDTSSLVEKVTVITVGTKSAEPTIRKALAIGADDAIRIDAEPTDAYAVAAKLADVLKDEDFGFVMCGIESCDYNGFAVGGMLSEFLNLPSVSAVSGIEVEGEKVSVSRSIDGGKEIISIDTPFVAIVQKGISIEPRIPAMRGIMMARKKPLNVVEASDTEILTNHKSFELPQPKPPCKMIDPENVKELFDLLQNEAKVIS